MALVFRILFFFFLCAQVALADSADSVVKIRSSYKNSSTQFRVGSGLLIKWGSRRFVLTSDHVVFHSNNSFIHQMLDSAGRSVGLTYLLSDAGKGLALMELSGTAPQDLNSYPVTAEWLKPLSLGSSSTMAGYPADSDDVLVSQSGQIHNLAMASNLFIELPTLVEVTEGHAEFGMSGGAAFSAEGFYQGLLSHQVEKNGKNTILVIPAAQIYTWLQEVLNPDGTFAKPSPILFVQDPAQQVSDFLSYRTGSLFITMVEPYGKNAGAGFEVLPTKKPSTDQIFLPELFIPAFEYLNKNPGTRLRVMGYRQNKPFGDIRGGTSGNLTLDLRTLTESDVEPLFTIEGWGREQIFKAIETQRKSLLTLQTRLDFSRSPQIRNYLQTIIDLTSSFDSTPQDSNDGLGPWRFLKPKDLVFLLTDTSLDTEWKPLLQQAQGALLQKSFQELHRAFSELTL